VKIEESQENIVVLSDIRENKLRALSPYGPVKAGLTTLPRTKVEVQLSELLNSLESVVDDLNFKSFTAYDTLNTAMENLRRVLLSDTLIEEDGIDTICNECGNDTVAEGQDKCLECLENMI
jgi:hypothetical protein